MGCTRFYTVKPGNTCNFVANRYGATFEDFRSWNTAVDATCSNLFIGQAYCVAGERFLLSCDEAQLTTSY